MRGVAVVVVGGGGGAAEAQYNVRPGMGGEKASGESNSEEGGENS